MTFTFLREDVDFVYYAFTNTGGNVMVIMTANRWRWNDCYPDIPYDDWFPEVVLPIVADSDGTATYWPQCAQWLLPLPRANWI